MLVHSITCVDDVRLDSLSEELRRPRCAMPDDNHIDAHRLEIARCIDERLAFEDARPRRRNIHRVGRQSLLRKLERDSRTSRALEEKIDDGRAAKSRNFLYRPLADFLERLGGIENEVSVRSTKARGRVGPCRARLSRLVFARSRYDHDCRAPVNFVNHHVDASSGSTSTVCQRCRRGLEAHVRRDLQELRAKFGLGGRSRRARRVQHARCVQ